MASVKSLLINLLSKKTTRYSGDIIYENNNIKSLSKSKYNSEISVVYQELKRPYFKMCINIFINI